MKSSNNPVTTPKAFAQAEARKRSDAAKKANVLYTTDEIRKLGPRSWQYLAHQQGGDAEVRRQAALLNLAA